MEYEGAVELKACVEPGRWGYVGAPKGDKFARFWEHCVVVSVCAFGHGHLPLVYIHGRLMSVCDECNWSWAIDHDTFWRWPCTPHNHRCGPLGFPGGGPRPRKFPVDPDE